MKIHGQFFFIIIMLIVTSCNNSLNDLFNGDSGNGKTFTGAKVIASVGDLPVCSFKSEGQLYYIQAEAEFMFCDGITYQSIDLTGPQGAKGDDGLDGTDGTNGLDGDDGADGLDGTDGTNDLDGDDGTDGLDGISIQWLGSLGNASAPVCNDDALNNAYYNTDNGSAYICAKDASEAYAWTVLAEGGSSFVVNRTTSGELTQNEIWRGTVHVTGDVVIPEEFILKIDAGTQVSFDQGVKIENRGNLLAIGNLDDGIVQFSQPEKQRWYGIDNTGNLKIEYAKITDATIGITTYIGPAWINYVWLTECHHGILIYSSRSSETLIYRSTFNENQGTGILTQWGGSAQIMNSEIHDNGGA